MYRKLIKLVEHKSSSYGPRTYVNAASGDITIALAVDHTTAGEKCTRKAVGDPDKLFAITPRERDRVEVSRMLFSKMRRMDAHNLNVAGNGIYTLSKHGVSQQAVNQYVFDLLKPVADHWEIKLIVSGGQTGVDMAGAVAAAALGIPAVLTFPKGFKQRFEDGVDIEQTEETIYRQIEEGVAALKDARHVNVGAYVQTDYSGIVTSHKVVAKEYSRSQSGVVFQLSPPVRKSGGADAWIDSDWFTVVDV